MFPKAPSLGSLMGISNGRGTAMTEKPKTKSTCTMNFCCFVRHPHSSSGSLTAMVNAVLTAKFRITSTKSMWIRMVRVQSLNRMTWLQWLSPTPKASPGRICQGAHTSPSTPWSQLPAVGWRYSAHRAGSSSYTLQQALTDRDRSWLC